MTAKHPAEAIRRAHSLLKRRFCSVPEPYAKDTEQPYLDESSRFVLTLIRVEERAKSRRNRTLAHIALGHHLYWFDCGDQEFAPTEQKKVGPEFDGYIKVLENYCVARKLEVPEHPMPPFWSELVGVAPHLG